MSTAIACPPKDEPLRLPDVDDLALTSLDQTDLRLHPRAAPGFDGAASSPSTSVPGVALQIYRDLAAVEAIWRRLESEGDCTVFQTYGWCTTWMHHIGWPAGVLPVIVVGRGQAGEVLFLLPLAITRAHGMRRLGWLAADLCDYNGPLLARSFADTVAPGSFPALWRAICHSVAGEAALRFDIVLLDKMAETVGGQSNPFMSLAVSPNASGAYSTRLAPDWEEFYASKRSSATRRRDRTKLKKLGTMGTVAFVTPEKDSEVLAILDALFVQKCVSLAQMGVADIFARPGYQAFFRAMATDPATRDVAHVSRLDVGETLAAANFGLLWQGSYYHVLASYDHGPVSRYGPGAAHLHRLMQYAIDRGCAVFDFTIGDERYKREWADTELRLYDHYAARTLRGHGVVLAVMGYRWLKRLIKQTPMLWAAYTRARSLTGALKRRGAEPMTACDGDGDSNDT